MDRIINWLLLVIIFVFDPLAIALVIAANFAFEQSKDKVLGKFKENVKRIEDEFDSTLYDGLEFEPWDEFKEEFEPLIQEELAPQQEFDILDLNKDGIIDDEERAIAQSKIDVIENELQNTSLSGWRSNKMRQEAEELRQKISRNDNTIDYN
jgi:hypothetical protein